MAKPFNTLIPSIERRESGWHRIRERLLQNAKGTVHPTVTISREFGCEGHPLAEHLKGLLEQASGESWTVFDRSLAEEVASDEKVSLHLLSHLGNETHAGDVLKTQFGYPTHDEAYASVVKHVLQIASVGCAIIVGRGGAVVCQDLGNCFHFRLEARFAFRASALARGKGLPLAEAEKVVRTQSKLRERFISENLHTDITDSRWYDAVFNNERQSVEVIAQACLGLMVAGWPDKNFFKPPS